jgi:hypothetical protein
MRRLPGGAGGARAFPGQGSTFRDTHDRNRLLGECQTQRQTQNRPAINIAFQLNLTGVDHVD